MRPTARLRNVHFTGIGGAGMGALAAVLQDRGFSVSGSDRAESAMTEWLRGRGIRVSIGHDASNLPASCDALVFTAAVDPRNPELEAARARGISLVRRADMLGMVMDRRHGLAVAGTHGKSTTSGMLVHILEAAGARPGWAVGATWSQGRPGQAGEGEAFVVEADEYDRAFLCLHPVSAVVTNIDADHLDIYGSQQAIDDAFAEFLGRLPFYGVAVLNAEDAGTVRMAERLSGRVRTFGFATGDYRAVAVATGAEGASFDLVADERLLGRISLRVFGEHNVANALAAAALALEEGMPFEAVSRGLAAFPGMGRRLERIGERRGVTVFDDYAHHPAEATAALRALRPVAAARGGRLAVLFQPHLYSRTRDHAPEFARAFLECDLLAVLPVYAAREAPLPGVEGNLIADAALALGHADARFLAKEDGAVAMAGLLRDGDVCVTMGAGDVTSLAPRILEALA